MTVSTCEYQTWRSECSNPALWSVQHQEFADHLSPKMTCGRHLSLTCAESEYDEGDELIVKRVKFSV